jgi:hypothetical protein
LLLAKTREQLLVAIGQGKTAKAKIFAYLDFYKNPLNTKVRGGCPIFNIAVESDDHYPAIKKKIAEVFRSGQEEFAAIVKYGVDQGEFSNKIDPALIAFKFVAAIEGAVVICRVMDTARPMQALIKSLKAEIEGFEI